METLKKSMHHFFYLFFFRRGLRESKGAKNDKNSSGYKSFHVFSFECNLVLLPEF